MSSKNSSVQRSSSLARATAQTRSAIEGLQARLSGDAHDGASRHVSAVPDLSEPQETEEELERQLQAYFARVSPAPRSGPQGLASGGTQLIDELRIRVVDGVAERILAEWSCPGPGMSPTRGLGGELMEHLIQRILEQLRKPAELSNAVLPM